MNVGRGYLPELFRQIRSSFFIIFVTSSYLTHIRLQGFVLLWRHNGSIITVGDQVIGRVSRYGTKEDCNNFSLNQNSRYSLESKENGNNLMIRLAEPADEGNE